MTWTRCTDTGPPLRKQVAWSRGVRTGASTPCSSMRCVCTREIHPCLHPGSVKSEANTECGEDTEGGAEAGRPAQAPGHGQSRPHGRGRREQATPATRRFLPALRTGTWHKNLGWRRRVDWLVSKTNAAIACKPCLSLAGLSKYQ